MRCLRPGQQTSNPHLHNNGPTGCHLLGLKTGCKGKREAGCRPFPINGLPEPGGRPRESATFSKAAAWVCAKPHARTTWPGPQERLTSATAAFYRRFTHERRTHRDKASKTRANDGLRSKAVGAKSSLSTRIVWAPGVSVPPSARPDRTQTQLRSVPGSPAPRPGRGRRCPRRSCTGSTSLQRDRGGGAGAGAGHSRHLRVHAPDREARSREPRRRERARPETGRLLGPPTAGAGPTPRGGARGSEEMTPALTLQCLTLCPKPPPGSRAPTRRSAGRRVRVRLRARLGASGLAQACPPGRAPAWVPVLASPGSPAPS